MKSTRKCHKFIYAFIITTNGCDLITGRNKEVALPILHVCSEADMSHMASVMLAQSPSAVQALPSA